MCVGRTGEGGIDDGMLKLGHEGDEVRNVSKKK